LLVLLCVFCQHLEFCMLPVWLCILLLPHWILLCFWGNRVPCPFYPSGPTWFPHGWVDSFIFPLCWSKVQGSHLCPIPGLCLT
jgi:hypothetical protein